MYPIVCMNEKEIYFKSCKALMFSSTLLNTSILYSLFMNPIFVPAITSVICNPLFVLPSLFLNYAILQRYYIYFFDRSYITSMYL